MPAFDLRGYYEVTDIKFAKTGGMRFKLGQFYPLGDKTINIAGKMRHGELISLNYIHSNLYQTSPASFFASF